MLVMVSNYLNRIIWGFIPRLCTLTIDTFMCMSVQAVSKLKFDYSLGNNGSAPDTANTAEKVSNGWMIWISQIV